ncbi:membrane protein FxsA [Psychromonas sp. MB-3u-54]|uniref:FxsA family protein n=1 Tax=Psychromonas sp. MB-3u-54 TaxID=2058319 RepID=UPI000C32E870|nr:FxsA family protein [Psychromonas sp. MB-3u-54]PKH02155.1 membrane protein FxsA [Psychromonas sp. MB-3u-54]
MFAKLFLTMVSVSLLEIYVLIKVGGFLGAWPTVALVVLTAFIGSALVRSQGLQVLRQFQERIAHGESPGQELIEGFMLLVTGVLLVTPGFVTDFLGLLILQPSIRSMVAKYILANVKLNPTMSGGFSPSSSRSTFGDDVKNKRADGNIIEGEFERKDDNKDQ